MNQLPKFKTFVKQNPHLISFVKKGEMTWQKFYELYDLYGEDKNVWDTYTKKEETNDLEKQIGINDFVTWFKNIDMDKMQEGIKSVERVLSVLQDFGDKEEPKSTYEPRPIYKHFED